MLRQLKKINITKKPKQETTCPICKTESKIIFTHNKYRFYKCPKCTLVFLNPKQIDSEGKTQYLKNETSPSDYYKQIQQYDHETFVRRLKVIRKFARTGELLDIGSSIGTFLKTARGKGWKATGIEPNPEAVKFAKKYSGAKVIQGFFNSAFIKLHKKKYDMVYSSDVIEHLQAPVEFLKLTKFISKKSGVVVTITPDFDHFLTRLFQIKPREHLLYLNKASLKILHQKAGLNILYMGNIHRERSVKAMLSSTTFENKPLWRMFISIVNILGVYLLIEFALSFFKEDVMVIGQIKASS